METINNFILRFVYIIKLGKELKLEKEEIQSMLESNQEFLFKDFDYKTSLGLITATVVAGIIIGILLMDEKKKEE